MGTTNIAIAIYVFGGLYFLSGIIKWTLIYEIVKMLATSDSKEVKKKALEVVE